MRRAPHEGPAPLARKRHQLLVAAPGAAQPQQAMGKDAAFQESIELVLDKLWQARCAPGFDLREKRFEVFPHQAIQDRFLWPPPLVVDRVCRRGACADSGHCAIPRHRPHNRRNELPPPDPHQSETTTTRTWHYSGRCGTLEASPCSWQITRQPPRGAFCTLLVGDLQASLNQIEQKSPEPPQICSSGTVCARQPDRARRRQAREAAHRRRNSTFDPHHRPGHNQARAIELPIRLRTRSYCDEGRDAAGIGLRFGIGSRMSRNIGRGDRWRAFASFGIDPVTIPLRTRRVTDCVCSVCIG